jgi:3-methyladenine DNA glycosylase/8-oxoguanine DNA glycosylase
MVASTRTFTTPTPVDLRLTLGPLQRGAGDPTMRLAADGVWRATRTAAGPATVRLAADGCTVTATAWGPGAEAALDGAPGLAGAEDDEASFDPAHPVVRGLRRRLRGLRIPRSGAVVETLVPSILEQRVAGRSARRSYAGLVRAHGEPAPGPGGDAGMLLPPTAATWAGLPSWAWHRFGVERRRADTVRRVCAVAPSLDRLAALPPAAAGAALRSVPGVGAWTAAEVGTRALGDADAVSVGDFHLPHQAAWVLAGEPRGTDDRMLELLAPFAGHRGRVLRLIEAAGIVAPRFGPRAPIPDVARL